MMKRYFFGLLTMLLVLSACEQDDSSFPLLPVDIRAIEYHLDSEVVGPATLYLNLRTQEIYGCVNYSIDHDLSFEGGVLTIRLKEASIGDICLTATGPASLLLELPTTTTQLVLQSGDETNVYDMSITAESVSFTAVNTSFSRLEESIFNRYPENSFALVCGTYNERPNFCAELKNHLMANAPSLEEFSFGPGVVPYGYSDGNWINVPSSYFYYNNENDYQQAGQLFQDYINQNAVPNEGISARLEGWNNLNFWSFRD